MTPIVNIESNKTTTVTDGVMTITVADECNRTCRGWFASDDVNCIEFPQRRHSVGNIGLGMWRKTWKILVNLSLELVTDWWPAFTAARRFIYLFCFFFLQNCANSFPCSCVAVPVALNTKIEQQPSHNHHDQPAPGTRRRWKTEITHDDDDFCDFLNLFQSWPMIWCWGRQFVIVVFQWKRVWVCSILCTQRLPLTLAWLGLLDHCRSSVMFI